MQTAFELRPVAGALGAEVAGLDLAGGLAVEQQVALMAALAEHEVLFFRDQRLDAGRLEALGQSLGTLSAHPAYPHPDHPAVAVLEHTRERPSKIELWHTDMTFMPAPPLGSILTAQVVPAAGGDTWFASSKAAYDALSPPMQAFLDGLHAEHSFAHGFKESLAEAPPEHPLWAAVRANPPVVHPVVRVHPVTGRKGLFVNRLFTTRIVELSAAESATLLEFLWRHATTPEFTCRFRWQPGSVAFWDNRATLHRPTNDYGFQHRRMIRVTLAGDPPVGPT
ncbi:MAG: TauD/TfdA family dioxygenase [Myxococcales bacterium]|nr:TauD/TfdA family dioxygenase [Myxococcales bacterium]